MGVKSKNFELKFIENSWVITTDFDPTPIDIKIDNFCNEKNSQVHPGHFYDDFEKKWLDPEIEKRFNYFIKRNMTV